MSPFATRKQSKTGITPKVVLRSKRVATYSFSTMCWRTRTSLMTGNIPVRSSLTAFTPTTRGDSGLSKLTLGAKGTRLRSLRRSASR